MTNSTIEFLLNQGNQLLNLAKKTDIDEAQITLVKSFEIGTRFGENHITQNCSSDLTNLAVTLVKNQKLGKIFLNLPKSDSYQRVIDDALTMLQYAEPDKDFPSFIKQSTTNPAFQRIQTPYSIEKIADSVHNIITTAHDYDSAIKTVAGNINSFNDYRVFLNTNGVELWESSNRISSVINVSANKSGNEFESRSSIKVAGKTLDTLQLEQNTKVVAERAKRGLDHQSIDIGSYTSIFSPSAVSALLRFINMGSSAEGLVNHSSFLIDKVGEQVFDSNLTITNERNNPQHFSSSSYDSEGTPTKAIKFIDQGVLKDYSYNRRLAKKLIDNEQGNGNNASGFGGEMPMFFSDTISSGSKSEEELIKSIDSGIYIVDLFYNNFVNSPEGLCTGLTKDGLFKIENGEIVGSLTNMRWTDKIESIFKSIEVANNTMQIGGFFFGSTITPSIKTDRFTFTSAGKH